MTEIQSSETSDPRHLLPALLITLVCLSPLLVFTAYWATNDDVGMAMIAGGFGAAAYASPALIHSNVLWGYLVALVPGNDWISSYTIISYLLVLSSLMGLSWCLLRSRVPFHVVLLFVIPPALSLIVFPQYTKTAGVAAVTACCLVASYKLDQRAILLMLAMGLVLAADLARDLEFLAVMFVALPLLPWKLLGERKNIVAAAFLIPLLLVAYFLNWQYYQAPDWALFLELKQKLAQFTDYGATSTLLQQPALLAEHGYSKNDVFLLGNWFFADTQIADPARLELLLAAISSEAYSLDGILPGLNHLVANQFLYPSIFAALIVLVLNPHPRVIAAWLLLILIAAVLGFANRPAPGRVLMPVFALLTFLPILMPEFSVKRLRYPGVIVLLVAACIGQLWLVHRGQTVMQAEAHQAEQAAELLSKHPAAVWGDVLATETLFRPFGDRRYRTLQYYDLGQMAHAPNSVASRQTNVGSSFAQSLTSESGIHLLATTAHFQVLAVYCLEHFSGQLLINNYLTLSSRGRPAQFNRTRCVPGAGLQSEQGSF